MDNFNAFPAQSQSTLCIPLTRGYVSIIDTVDCDLATRKWCANVSARGTYAIGSWVYEDGIRRKAIMHRLILERALNIKLTKYQVVDHINGDKLDNRRSNLRIATFKENAINSRTPRSNASGYKGVHYVEQSDKWESVVYVDGKRKSLGVFDTPELAFKAYQQESFRLHGRFANDGTLMTVRIPVTPHVDYYKGYAELAYQAFSSEDIEWGSLPNFEQQVWIKVVQSIFSKMSASSG